MIRTKGRRPLTCHHEAGHALVRWYFGYDTDRAVVLTVEEVRAGQQVENRRGVLVTYEGMVDAYDICGYPHGPKDVTLDPDTAANFLRQWSVNRDIGLIECYAGFYAEAAYLRSSVAGSMLAGGGGDMRGSKAILDAWDLTREERSAIEYAAEKRAAALVRSPMGSVAIRGIAAALLERGEIEGDEIASLCRAAHGGRECAYGAWPGNWPPTLTQIRSGHIPEPPAASRAAA